MAVKDTTLLGKPYYVAYNGSWVVGTNALMFSDSSQPLLLLLQLPNFVHQMQLS
jgi:hypothetical protein